MTQPRLPEVENVVGRLLHEIRETTDQDVVWIVDGPATAGKSALLRTVAERLRDGGSHAVLSAAPARAMDAGPMVLAQIAGGLKDAGLVNGQTELLRDSALPLPEKVAAVRRWILDSDGAVVLLFDEPGAWPDWSDQTEHFSDRTRFVIDELVRDIPCRRVIAGDPPEGLRAARHFTIGGSSEPDVFLRDAEAWGPLAGPAADLADEARGRLDGLSPLQLRLLVANVAVTSLERALTLLNPAWSRRQLSRRLLEVMTESGAYEDLLHAWRYLAHVRRPFASDLLDEVAGRLPVLSDALLRYCLLYRAGNDFVLHETLRRDIEDVMPELGSKRYEQLGELAQYYRSLWDTAETEGHGAAFPNAIDTFYYAARSGDASLLERSPFFVDQLDMLGKTLSYELHRWHDAAAVFDRATQLDEHDDYAHHYLAYNLDRLGTAADTVERHYRRAIDLNARHPWWWARMVCFQLTRGRTSAARNEWDRALDELVGADQSESVRFYETLHGWVADVALRRGQIAFANVVLSDVPALVRTESTRITALIRRLRAMELAEMEGAYVPAQYLVRDWWKHGPFLLSRRIGENQQLTLRRWLAGRVEAIDLEEVTVRVREIDVENEADPRRATLRIRIPDFNRLTRDQIAAELEVGQFVEIGLYSDTSEGAVQRLIRIHPDRQWQDAELTNREDTDRYWS